MDTSVPAEVMTVYRALDDSIRHARCGERMVLQARRVGSHLVTATAHGKGARMKLLLLAIIVALAGCGSTTRIGAGECVVFKDSWFSAERTVIGHGCDVKRVYE